ncbi:MAG: cytochrome P450 [Alphaproteobacteria bacterium]|jgi:cytochrome P450|tara:strand:+ start:398 stop:1642 length:1245 start_codon:yes stop_codon:yes gene_type:complete
MNKEDFKKIAYPETYADEKELHDIFTFMRKNDPVSWVEPDQYRPFWAITKHEDIIEIEKQNELFINDPRTTLMDIPTEDAIKEFTGGSHLLVRSLVHMDNPDHQLYRSLTQKWFAPPNLESLKKDIRNIAKEYVNKMVDHGNECDFAKDVAIFYPLRVIMSILGVPKEDEPRMLRLTQELFGGRDEDMIRDESETSSESNTITDFFEYFTALTEDRRKNPTNDVSSVIANAQINNEQLGHLEAMSYYVIIATAGHDTTSSSTAGGILALIENPEQLSKLKNNPSLMTSAVEETIRWVTPVKNFFRTATQNYDLKDRKIKKDDSILLCYPSGNRDEEIFDDPFQFKVDRSPNRHLAFGHGAHLCLGKYLAKIEMEIFYEELFKKIENIELNGEPEWVKASFVSGLKSLPIRYTLQ